MNEKDSLGGARSAIARWRRRTSPGAQTDAAAGGPLRQLGSPPESGSAGDEA